MNAPNDPNRWPITTFEEAEKAIDILRRRTAAQKVDITLLEAQLDYLATPRYRYRRRRLQRAFITYLSREGAE